MLWLSLHIYIFIYTTKVSKILFLGKNYVTIFDEGENSVDTNTLYFAEVQKELSGVDVSLFINFFLISTNIPGIISRGWGVLLLSDRDKVGEKSSRSAPLSWPGRSQYLLLRPIPPNARQGPNPEHSRLRTLKTVVRGIR